jgi:hypothetical protein
MLGHLGERLRQLGDRRPDLLRIRLEGAEVEVVEARRVAGEDLL